MKKLILALALAIPIVACNTMDYATPQEAATIESLEAQRDAALAAGDQELADQLNAQIAEMDRGIAERTVGNAIGLIESQIPLPLKIFTPFLATLFFKRVRRTAVKSIKGAATVLAKSATAAKAVVTGDMGQAGTAIGEMGQAIGDFVDSTMSIVGLMDSRKDTIEEMQEHADEMRAAGDDAGAALLESQIESMKAKTA